MTGGCEFPITALEGLELYGVEPEAIDRIKRDFAIIIGEGAKKCTDRDMHVWLSTVTEMSAAVQKQMEAGPISGEANAEKKNKLRALRRKKRSRTEQVEHNAFKALDKDGSGAISSAEFADVREVLGIALSDVELEDLQAEFGGDIDFERFSAWLHSKTLVASRVKTSIYTQFSGKDGEKMHGARMLRGVRKLNPTKLVKKKVQVAPGEIEEVEEPPVLYYGETLQIFDMLEKQEDGSQEVGRDEVKQLGGLVGIELSVTEIHRAMDELDPDVVGTFGSAAFVDWMLDSASDVASKIIDSMDVRMEIASGETVEVNGRVCDGGSFDTVRACKYACKDEGKWYYEVLIGDKGTQRLGFARLDYQIDSDSGDALGDACSGGMSWALDGRAWMKSADGLHEEFGPTEIPWQTGDVIGCMLDCNEKTIAFSLNGAELGEAFVDIDIGEGVYPAASVTDGPHIFAYSAADCQHAPPGYRNFTLGADTRDFGIEAITMVALQDEVRSHGETWLASADFDFFDLIGLTIKHNQYGIGLVLDYTRAKVGRGHTIRFNGLETKISLERRSVYTVMNQEYVNRYIAKELKPKKEEVQEQEDRRIIRAGSIETVAALQIKQKIHVEKHGSDKPPAKLQQDDVIHLFAVLDTFGQSEVLIEESDIKRLFKSVKQTLKKKNYAVAMDEIREALEVPEWWAGQMTTSSLNIWLECGLKFGTRLKNAALENKEQELLDVLFKQLDADGDGELQREEIMKLGIVTHVDLSEKHLLDVCKEMDIDEDGHVYFEEFRFWFLGESKIAAKVKNRSVTTTEMQGRESQVKLLVESGQTVQLKLKVVEKANYETIRACKAVSGGRWYYEVLLGDKASGHIGYARADFECDASNETGVGDPNSQGQSWGYDGRKLKKHNHGPQEYPLPDSSGKQITSKWKTGDTVGCFLDLDKHTIGFSLNGNDLGVAFEEVRATAKLPIFPCATLRNGPHLFRFSRTECKYIDRHPDYRSFTLAPDDSLDTVAEAELRRKRRNHEEICRGAALQHGEAWTSSRKYKAADLLGHHVDISKTGQGSVRDYTRKRGHIVQMDDGGTLTINLMDDRVKFRVQSEDYVNKFVRHSMEEWDSTEREAGERVDQVTSDKIRRKRKAEKAKATTSVKKDIGNKLLGKKGAARLAKLKKKAAEKLSRAGDEVEAVRPEDSEIEAMFAAMDEDGSGTLALEEMALLGDLCGAILTEEEVAAMLEEADMDGDGTIIYEEFHDWMDESGSEVAARCLEHWREQSDREEEEAYELGQFIFDKMDAQQEGFIIRAQIDEIPKIRRIELSSEELDTAWEEANTTGTDNVDMDGL